MGRSQIEISLLNWIPFCRAILEQVENWSKMERTIGTIWKEELVSKDWRRGHQLNFETKDSRNLCWSPGSSESNFCVSPRLRIDRRWTMPMAQFGMNIWFQKIGEEGINSILKRKIQRPAKNHQNRTRAILCIAKNGGVRGHSWICLTLGDAWESMNLEVWFGDLGHMMTRSHTMITETKLASRW